MRGERREARAEDRFFAWRWFLLASCLSILVSACGFHLREAVELPPVMARTYIAGAANSPLYYELESALLAAGSEVVETEQAATAILTIRGERYGRRVLSVDSAGRASEYELSLLVSYSLTTGDGTLLAEKGKVSLLRDYRFDPDNVLASGVQEETLQMEMRRYAVRQILRRLQSSIRSPQLPAAVAPQE